MMIFELGLKAGSRLAVALVAALLAPMVIGATIDLPMAEDFESYSSGTDLTSVSSPWEGNAPTSIVVVAEDPGYGFGYALPSSTHSNVAEVANSTLAEFTINEYTNAVHIFVDVMMKPVPRSMAPVITDSNVHAAVFLSEAGLINIFAKTRVNLELDPPESQLGKWIELDHPPIPTGTWFRLSMQFSFLKHLWYVDEETGDPLSYDYADNYYRVAVNGGNYITHPDAYDIEHAESTISGTGTWFYTANFGTVPHPFSGPGIRGLENHYISSVATEGPGLIDDLVVSSNKPPAAAGSIYGVPASWYANNGLWDPDGDADFDGMSNYQEFWAGTDALDGDSIFEFVVIQGGGTNKIYWTGDTSTTNVNYTLYMATNLTEVTPWSVLDSVVRVAPGMTNIYQHANPPSVVFYHLGVPFSY
jgi:hypothetical protein